MPERLRKRLMTQKYYLTTDLNIVTFLASKKIIPYNCKEDKYNKDAIAYFYTNTSKLRACLYEWYNLNAWLDRFSHRSPKSNKKMLQIGTL